MANEKHIYNVYFTLVIQKKNIREIILDGNHKKNLRYFKCLLRGIELEIRNKFMTSLIHKFIYEIYIIFILYYIILYYMLP